MRLVTSLWTPMWPRGALFPVLELEDYFQSTVIRRQHRQLAVRYSATYNVLHAPVPRLCRLLHSVHYAVLRRRAACSSSRALWRISLVNSGVDCFRVTAVAKRTADEKWIVAIRPMIVTSDCYACRLMHRFGAPPFEDYSPDPGNLRIATNL